jgi:hypothetical protein
MDVVVASRGGALEFVWKDWLKLRATLIKMTFDPGRHSKNNVSGIQKPLRHRYSNLLGFSVLCMIVVTVLMGNVDNENVSLSMLAVLFGWDAIFVFVIVSAVHKYSLTEPISAASTYYPSGARVVYTSFTGSMNKQLAYKKYLH